MIPSKWRLTFIMASILIAIVLVGLIQLLMQLPSQSEAYSKVQTEPQIPIPYKAELPTFEIQIEESELQDQPVISVPIPSEPAITLAPAPLPIPTPTPTVTTHEQVNQTSPIAIPVLNYHSVTVQPGNIAAITPAKLEEQMQYLADQGYRTLTLNEFIDIWEGKEKPPEKPILLTFDDGYKDNYTEAMPILAKYQFHATVFVSPGMVEDGYFLNWDDIKEMHENGWDIQPHGMTHLNLATLNAEKQLYEITEARRQIEEQLGSVADVYCYPYGARNQTSLKILKENGFRYAFTIDQGMAKPNQNPLLIHRLFVNGEAGINSFKALLK